MNTPRKHPADWEVICHVRIANAGRTVEHLYADNEDSARKLFVNFKGLGMLNGVSVSEAWLYPPTGQGEPVRLR